MEENKKKNKGFIITLSVIVILIMGFIVYFVIANKKANELYEKIINYELKTKELENEKTFDFSENKYFNISGISDGIIQKDSDGKISIISNIKVMGLYCKYDKKMKCSIFNNKNTNISAFTKNNTYKIGDSVILKDNSKWHVISNSSEYSNYITLIKDERIDINNDGCTLTTGSKESDPDLFPFDSTGSKKYDITSESNIGYYLENKYKSYLSTYNEVLSIRLPYSEELDKVKELIGFEGLTEEEKQNMMDIEDKLLESIGWMEESPRPVNKLQNITINEDDYNKLMPHWLYNSLSGNYWIYPLKGKTYTVVWDGDGLSHANPKTGYGVKPIITISKNNI